MPSLKRRLELIKGDISQNTALLEPIAGPSNMKRTRICPKCEQVIKHRTLKSSNQHEYLNG